MLQIVPEMLALVCEFLDPMSLLQVRTVNRHMSSVASAAANRRLRLQVKVREGRRTFRQLQLLPAAVGLLLTGTQAFILWTAVSRHRRGLGVVSSVPVTLATVNTVGYTLLYVIWMLQVWGMLRLRHRTLLGLTVVGWAGGVVCGVAGCTQTHSERLMMALVLPEAFAFALFTLWAAFWDTDASRHPQLRDAICPPAQSRGPPTAQRTYGTFGNIDIAGAWYGHVSVL